VDVDSLLGEEPLGRAGGDQMLGVLLEKSLLDGMRGWALKI
jgi:hypothetical protein